MMQDENGLRIHEGGDPVTAPDMLALERQQHCCLCANYTGGFCLCRNVPMKPDAWCEKFAWE